MDDISTREPLLNPDIIARRWVDNLHKNADMLLYNYELQMEVHWTEDEDLENIQVIPYYRPIATSSPKPEEKNKLPPNSLLPSFTHLRSRHMPQTRFAQPLNKHINVYVNHNVVKVENGAELEFRVKLGGWQSLDDAKSVERAMWIEWREVTEGAGLEKWYPAFRADVERFSDDFLGPVNVDGQVVG